MRDLAAVLFGVADCLAPVGGHRRRPFASSKGALVTFRPIRARIVWKALSSWRWFVRKPSSTSAASLSKSLLRKNGSMDGRLWRLGPKDSHCGVRDERYVERMRRTAHRQPVPFAALPGQHQAQRGLSDGKREAGCAKSRDQVHFRRHPRARRAACGLEGSKTSGPSEYSSCAGLRADTGRRTGRSLYCYGVCGRESRASCWPNGR